MVLVYLIASSPNRSASAYATLIALVAYVIFGAATYMAATLWPAYSRARLAFTTFADQASVIAMLAVGGSAALPLLWGMFWFLVGAGCRYGQRMLALSCGVALVGLVGLMQWQPWWRANFTAALGIAFSVAAASLYLAVLVHRLERQALTDPLTGLDNRIRLEQAIGRTLSARGTEAGCVAMLLVDLDGFKEVNDSFGHAVGDELLRSFATMLVRRMPRKDTLARLGGDEFVVLARRVCNKKDALAVADSIHAILGDMRTVSGYPIAVSCSIGVCLLTERAGNPRVDARSLMRAVDGAMYRAKSRGVGNTEFVETADVTRGGG
ncbi:MAG TPA: GGDEF domain-containing protein [Paraburkholderia sp.]|nr:GGDEF domain-containing protein [Paraburkholderia sp.]